MTTIRILCAISVAFSATVHAEDQIRSDLGGVAAQADADGISVQTEVRDDGPWLSIENRGETGVVHCRGRNVSISGKRNSVRLSGECPYVEVSGDKNEIRMEAVGEISISGDDNRLFWQRSTLGGQPQVGDDGEGNQITQVD